MVLDPMIYESTRRAPEAARSLAFSFFAGLPCFLCANSEDDSSRRTGNLFMDILAPLGNL